MLNLLRQPPLAVIAFLPLIAAWSFVPQLTGAFEIKHHLMIAGCLLLALTWLANGKLVRIAVPAGWVGLGLAIWLIGVLLSWQMAENSYLATRMLLEVLACLVLGLALFNFHDAPSLLRSMEGGLITAGAGVALFALKQALFPDWLDPGFSAQGKLQIYSTLGNPNIAALAMLPAVPLAAWRAWSQQGKGRALYVLGTLALLGGLAATQARHALIALVVTALVAMLWKGTPPVRRASQALLLTAVCIAAAMVFIELPPSVAHSLKGRAFVWLTSLHMLGEHPLYGAGLGQYGLAHMAHQADMFASGRFDAYFDNAAVISEGHNDFLNWGAMSGVFGLLGFSLLCASTLWHGWISTALKERAPQLYLAFIGMLTAMVFIAVSFYTVPALFFWMLLGMVWAVVGLPRLGVAPFKAGRLMLAALLAALLFVDMPLAWHETRAEYIEARGDELMQEHEAWLARREYLRALEEYPHNGRLRKKYAMTLYLSGELLSALPELKIASSDSGDLGIDLLEGELRARAGDFERAAAVYRKISAAFPNLVSAHFALGQIYNLQGQTSLARNEFHKVLDIRPSPFNLNLTPEKVELQKRLVREYLAQFEDTARHSEPPMPPIANER
jgi:tetratricopeptide (TPR) repeat protein